MLITNKDLSLLTNLSEDDIHHLQSVGKDAQAARKKFILKDDQEVIWNHLQSLRGDRIDFVLDNCALSFWSSSGVIDRRHDLFFSTAGFEVSFSIRSFTTNHDSLTIYFSYSLISYLQIFWWPIRHMSLKLFFSASKFKFLDKNQSLIFFFLKPEIDSLVCFRCNSRWFQGYLQSTPWPNLLSSRYRFWNRT